jgi:hypothetical protein
MNHGRIQAQRIGARADAVDRTLKNALIKQLKVRKLSAEVVKLADTPS